MLSKATSLISETLIPRKCGLNSIQEPRNCGCFWSRSLAVPRSQIGSSSACHPNNIARNFIKYKTLYGFQNAPQYQNTHIKLHTDTLCSHFLTHTLQRRPGSGSNMEMYTIHCIEAARMEFSPACSSLRLTTPLILCFASCTTNTILPLLCVSSIFTDTSVPILCLGTYYVLSIVMTVL